MAQDYINVKIDTEKMAHGAEVALKLRGKRGGIPWITILTPEKKQLVTSDGPQGNIGCPLAEHEIDWFMKMIAKTAKNLDSQEQGQIKAALVKYATKERRR